MSDPIENDVVEEKTSSPEERFFGVSTEIDLDDDDLDDEEESLEAEAEEKPEEPEKDEAEEYGKRVQERINRLTWEREEAKRQAQAIKAERDEAFKATQAMYAQNQNYQQIINDGEAELIHRIKSGAEAKIKAAEAEYRKAYEEGDDVEKVIAAQREMLQAQAELNEASNAEADYQFRQQEYAKQQQYRAYQQQYQQPQQQQQPQRTMQPREPDAEAAEWGDKNPWFNDPKHRDMTAIALAKHETLVMDEGVTPNTPRYYDEIDKEMRRRFPDYDGWKKTNSVNPVVAGAQRGGKKRQTKTQLTQSQKSIARKLGLTYEQYANGVLKLQEGIQ